jgi:hypothetical protein
MSSCNVVVVNSSDRTLDKVLMWHTSSEPVPSDVSVGSAVINGSRLANGAKATGSAGLTWGSPTDYWTMSVLFQGDGTSYVMASVTADAYKEYEVSSGSTITFTINTYTAGTTDQNDITIAYTGDDGGSARLLNPITADIFGPLGEILSHVVVEAAVG